MWECVVDWVSVWVWVWVIWVPWRFVEVALGRIEGSLIIFRCNLEIIVRFG